MFHEAKCDVERSLGEIQAHCCTKFVASIKFGAGRIYHGRPSSRATKKTDIAKGGRGERERKEKTIPEGGEKSPRIRENLLSLSCVNQFYTHVRSSP